MWLQMRNKQLYSILPPTHNLRTSDPFIKILIPEDSVSKILQLVILQLVILQLVIFLSFS